MLVPRGPVLRWREAALAAGALAAYLIAKAFRLT